MKTPAIHQLNAILRDISDGVRAQPGRAGLSGLAVAAGMGALTFLLMALGGLREKAGRLAGELGGDVIAVMSDRSAGTESKGRAPTDRAVSVLRAGMGDCVIGGLKRYELLPGDTAGPARLVGVDDQVIAARQWALIKGRALDSYDILHRARAAVVSRKLAERPGWDLGRTVRLRGTAFTVVGVVGSDGGSLESENPDLTALSGSDTVLVPISTARSWDVGNGGRDELDVIFMRVPDHGRLDRVISGADRILCAPDVQCTACSWITPESVLAGVRRLERTVLAVAGSVAVLCIALGGTILASLMVINVKDRMAEIGLRQALGAERADISRLFVAEGLLVCGAGALAGTFAAHIIIAVARPILPCPVDPGAVTLFVPLAVSLGVGVGASYWPARLAARIMPAEALRSE